MRVFVDTNVILDYILQREHFVDARRAIEKIAAAQADMMISAGGFYTMLFLVDKYFRKDCHKDRKEARALTRSVMRIVLGTFLIAEHDGKSLLEGVDDVNFNDIEDSCQYQLACKHGCTMLVTLNISDYPYTAKSGIKVVTPMDM